MLCNSRVAFAWCILILISLYYPCRAQQREVHGFIIDDSTRKPIAGVMVLMRKGSDTSAPVLKGRRTDRHGAFTLTVSALDTLLLQTQRIGYSSYEKTIDPSTRPEIIDTIALHAVDVITSDVQVTAWRYYEEIKADKKSYQVKNNPNINGNSVSEVLDQIPAVQVDENGLVLLRGDANVQIMIDDRPVNMDADQLGKFLQQLPANSIEKVEVRTTPGARYDAGSTAGIINIVTRHTLSDVLGLNGTLYASTNGRRGTSLNGLYSDSVLSISLNVGWRRWYDSTHAVYERLTPEDPTVGSLHKTVEYSNLNSSYFLKPQIDVRLGSDDYLSLNATINSSHSDNSGLGIGDRLGVQSELLQTIHDTSTAFEQATWLDVSLVQKHSFNDVSKLRTELSFSQFSPQHQDANFSIMSDTLAAVSPELSLRQKIQSTETHPEVRAKVDFNTKILREVELESGLQYNSEKHHNSYTAQNYNFENEQFEDDSASILTTNTYVKVSAAYLSLGYEFSPRWSAKSGLRFEYASIGSEDVISPIQRNYANFFPDFSLEWQCSEDVHLTAAMNRRVELPDVDDLNPLLYHNSSTYVIVGNPALRPSFTNSFELGVDANTGPFEFNVSPFLRRSTDVMRNSGYLDGPLIVNSTKNFNAETSTGVDAQVAYRIPKSLSARLNLSAFHYHNDGSDIPGDALTNSTNTNANLSVSYRWSDALSFSSTLRYSPAFKKANESVGSYFSSSFNAVASFWNKALTLNLLIADPFNLQRRVRVTYGEGYSLSSDSKSLSQYALLTLSYSLGRKGDNFEEHGTSQPGG